MDTQSRKKQQHAIGKIKQNIVHKTTAENSSADIIANLTTVKLVYSAELFSKQPRQVPGVV